MKYETFAHAFYNSFLNKELSQLKVWSSPSKKDFFICFNSSPSKLMKNAFHFILKALFVLKMFKFLF